MKRTRFTEEQIVGILEAGRSGLGLPAERISEATFYNCRAKYGG